MCAHERADVAAKVQVFIRADARERPREAEDEDGGHHRLEPLAEASAELVERHDAARQVKKPREDERDERAEHERLCGVAVRERLLHALAIVDAARVEHAEHAGRDEHDERQQEVVDPPLARRLARGIIVIIRVLVLRRDEEMRRVLAHRAPHRRVVASRPDDEEHEKEREPRVEVERDRLEEQAEPVDRAVLRQRGADGRRPARHRRDDADRRRRRVDDVGELRARDLELVRDGAHDRADRQAVEIVVDEDDDAEQRRHERGAALAADRAHRPLPVGARRARARDRRDEDAEDDEEHEDVDVAADLVLHDREHREDRLEDIAAREEQRPREDADDERHVDLLRPEGEGDRDDRRQDGPCCLCHR